MLIPNKQIFAEEDNDSTIQTQKDKFEEYGFSGELVKWVSNDRDYEWYEDQGNTGIYKYGNCGASVATMAAKWNDKSFVKTGEDARNAYLLNGEWWSADTIESYLDDNGVQNFVGFYSYDTNQIEGVIDRGKIFILLINTYYIKLSTDYYSVIGRFYTASTGHFILVKGYVKTTDNLYLEVYDPFSLGEVNKDNTYKGEVRYYEIDDINEAVKNKWEHMIVIEPNEY